MKRRGLGIAVWITLLPTLLAAPVAAQRTLSWDALDVTARLEADGALHVVEEHRMRFDGDWNGGERSFRLDRGHDLDLLAIERLDPDTGAATPLERGSLDRVDRYDWAGRNALRWRSRLPSDPPFEDEVLVYRLTYRLENLLQPVADGVYELESHDFAFPARAGPIRRFTLDLTVEPPFERVDAIPRHQVIEDLPAGRGVVQTVRVRYEAEGRPAAAVTPPPPLLLRLATLVSLAAALMLVVAGFVRSERDKGRRFGGPPVGGSVDRRWLETHVLSLPPEVVGAIWDRSIGAPEVAAVLARLVAEGKLASEVVETDTQGRPTEMRLTRLVKLDAFDDGERPLVEGLLFDGRRQVTTKELRTHYASTGFRPVGLVRSAIDRQVSLVLGPKPSLGQFKMACLGTLAASALCVVLFGVVVFTGSPTLVPALGGLFFTSLIAVAVALGARAKLFWLGRWTVGMALPVLFFVAFVALQTLMPADLGGPRNLFELFALFVLALTAWTAPFVVARSAEPPKAIEIRQRFWLARQHLSRELTRESPDLDDAWFPYLLALGLAPLVGRWAEQFGGRQTVYSLPTSVDSVGSSGSSGSSFTSGGGWTGGGAAFGGAGASASWATAAAAMTAGVSPPASSSGGGGSSFSGGSSSSSSGGGGGGGW